MFAAEFEPASSKRRTARAAVALDARYGEDRSGRTLCKVVDISTHGARIQSYDAPRRGSTIWLTLPACGQVAAEVMWADDYCAGCQFARPLDAEVVEELVRLNG